MQRFRSGSLAIDVDSLAAETGRVVARMTYFGYGDSPSDADAHDAWRIRQTALKAALDSDARDIVLDASDLVADPKFIDGLVDTVKYLRASGRKVIFEAPVAFPPPEPDAYWANHYGMPAFAGPSRPQPSAPAAGNGFLAGASHLLSDAKTLIITLISLASISTFGWAYVKGGSHAPAPVAEVQTVVPASVTRSLKNRVASKPGVMKLHDFKISSLAGKMSIFTVVALMPDLSYNDGMHVLADIKSDIEEDFPEASVVEVRAFTSITPGQTVEPPTLAGFSK